MADHDHDHTHEETPVPESKGPVTEEGAAAGGPPEDAGTEALSDALRVSFRFLKFAMVALIVIFLIQGIFHTSPGEVRIKLRFGRPVRVSLGAGRGKGYVMDSESGWHIRWPWEDVKIIPTGVQTREFHREFWYAGAGPSSELEKEALEQLNRDRYLVTGDANIVHLKLRVRYRIRSDEQGAMDYAFAMFRVDDEKVQHDLLDRLVIESTIETVGSWPAMAVMKERKEELLEGIRRGADEKLDEFERVNGVSVGVIITAVEYINEPVMPEKVRGSYYLAQQAASEGDSLRREAERAAELILGRAKGQAYTIKANAEAYKSALVNMAEADADALTKLGPGYKQDQRLAQILRHWHYQRTMEGLLGLGRDSFVVDEPPGAESRFLFSRPPRQFEKPETTTEASQ